MEHMFYNCENLKYLNLSNLDTSSVTNMSNLFDGCKSLKFLNINSFKENPNLNTLNMFNNIPGNLIYCIDDISKANKIISLLNSRNIENDCSDLCFSNNAKYNLESNSCSGDCNINSEYKYKYNNKCLTSCNNYYSYDQKECLDIIPDGFYLNSSTLKTIDKCPEKCNLCSMESMQNNLCTSCNSSFNELKIGLYFDCNNNIDIDSETNSGNESDNNNSDKGSNNIIKNDSDNSDKWSDNIDSETNSDNESGNNNSDKGSNNVINNDSDNIVNIDNGSDDSSDNDNNNSNDSENGSYNGSNGSDDVSNNGNVNDCQNSKYEIISDHSCLEKCNSIFF